MLICVLLETSRPPLPIKTLWFHAWVGGGREDRGVFSWDCYATDEKQTGLRCMSEIVEGWDKNCHCRDSGP